MKLTPSDVLAPMRPGHDYTATRLGMLIGSNPTTVARLLSLLVDDGRVRLSRSGTRSQWFRLADTKKESSAPGRADDNTETQTSVATQPVRRVMAGCLSDYETTLTAGRDLAMQTPGRNR
jgi:hypothetical protein